MKTKSTIIFFDILLVLLSLFGAAAKASPVVLGSSPRKGSYPAPPSERLRRKLTSFNTSVNILEVDPYCETTLGASSYCPYEYALGSGVELANWAERTQHIYTNMARQDPSAASSIMPSPFSYSCTTSTQKPLHWYSNVAEAARWKSYEMATTETFGHDTDASNANLFDGSVSVGDRIAKFVESPVTLQGYGENIAAGQATPIDVTKGWLESTGHCNNIYSSSHDYLSVGYYYLSTSPYGRYWTQNFVAVSSSTYEESYPVLMGSHDTPDGSASGTTLRYYVQWYSTTSTASSVVVYVNDTAAHTMSLLLGSSSSGTYYFDDATDTTDQGCVKYYFKITDSNGAIYRLPEQTGYKWYTYGIGNCALNYDASGLVDNAEPSVSGGGGSSSMDTGGFAALMAFSMLAFFAIIGAAVYADN